MLRRTRIIFLKLTTTENCNFMPCGDTNSHLTVKMCNFVIKFEGNSENYVRHILVGLFIEGGHSFLFYLGSFSNNRGSFIGDWHDYFTTKSDI